MIEAEDIRRMTPAQERAHRRRVNALDDAGMDDAMRGETEHPPLRLGGWAVIAACLVCGALILAAMAS